MGRTVTVVVVPVGRACVGLTPAPATSTARESIEAIETAIAISLRGSGCSPQIVTEIAQTWDTRANTSFRSHAKYIQESCPPETAERRLVRSAG